PEGPAGRRGRLSQPLPVDPMLLDEQLDAAAEQKGQRGATLVDGSVDPPRRRFTYIGLPLGQQGRDRLQARDSRFDAPLDGRERAQEQAHHAEDSLTRVETGVSPVKVSRIELPQRYLQEAIGQAPVERFGRRERLGRQLL